MISKEQIALALADAVLENGLRYVEDNSGRYGGGDWIECAFCRARADVRHRNSRPDIIPKTVEHKTNCLYAAYERLS